MTLDNFFRRLRKLTIKKKGSSSKNQQRFISRQLAIIEKEEAEARVERKFVGKLVARIKETEAHKEFNVSIQDFNKILKEKHVEENFCHLFIREIEAFRQKLDEVKKILGQQLSGEHSSEDLFELEMREYIELEKLVDEIDCSEDKIKTYFKDVSRLNYNRKYIKSGQIVSKLVNKMLLKLEVEGIENIPAKGACILAPHHHHAAIDPMILMAIINRPIFFLTSVETFIAVPLYGRFLYKIGCLPFKRDDSKFRERLPNAISKGRVSAYPSNNVASINRMLTHLKYNEAVVIFPEGDAKIIATYVRDSGQDFLEPAEGFVTLALLAKRKFGINVPIIPIGFNYAGGVFKTIKVNIGEPFILNERTQSLGGDELKKEIIKVANHIFLRIRELSED
jgi:1-acyl-sn-glycerol-3-phosphate acyltransferase